jgi:hypothetical protein
MIELMRQTETVEQAIKDKDTFLKLCKICGIYCDQLQRKKSYDYCCLHVPYIYIDKKLSEWLCVKCAMRKCMHD